MLQIGIVVNILRLIDFMLHLRLVIVVVMLIQIQRIYLLENGFVLNVVLFTTEI